ncbi:MAG: GNAT family N-acetyltransferase, partial [Chloroflexi bacterium]|nr:GNAT family N-acetyltransferase [Chloroflexota bacterium]
MPSIYSERLRLRAAERTDIPMFVRWISDPEITEHLLLRLPMSLAEEEHWFESMIARPAAQHVYVVEAKLAPAPGSDEAQWLPIGNTSFIDILEIDRCAEIGIMLGEKTWWNKGYGTETMRAMLRHGFETLNLHRIWLQVYANNKRGVKAYEKAGFRHEGMYREGHYQA